MPTTPSETPPESYEFMQTYMTVSKLISRESYICAGETLRVEVPGTDVVLLVRALETGEYNEVVGVSPLFDRGCRTINTGIKSDTIKVFVRNLIESGQEFYAVTMEGNPAEYGLLFSIEKPASAKGVAENTREGIEDTI